MIRRSGSTTRAPARVVWAADDVLLGSVAGLVRRLHEASQGYAAQRGFAAPPGSVWRRDLVRVEVPMREPERS